MIQSALLVMLAWLIVNGVDRVMSWQTFARPIVTAAITGLVLGDLTTGVVMGASLKRFSWGFPQSAVQCRRMRVRLRLSPWR